MKNGNVQIEEPVDIHSTADVNNVRLGKGVKIAKYCSVFGSEEIPLEIGEHSYVGMHSCLNGFRSLMKIGSHVSIAQNVNLMTDSGPNASSQMQKFYPIEIGEVIVGDHCWIGANAVILPNVTLGKFCVVGANSVVKTSFEDYSVVAGNPARVVRRLIPTDND